MASSYFLLVFLCLFFLVHSYVAKTSPRPILQITKDAETLQYVTQISQRTPLVHVKLTLDLSGLYMWVDCTQDYISSTYHPARCGSAPCRLLNATLCNFGHPCTPPAPGCYENTCQHYPYSPVLSNPDVGQFGADLFKIMSTDGMNALSVLTVPRLYFICGSTHLLAGLASGVTGIAGLGRTKASLPAQLSSYFKFDQKFALCLSSSTRSSGAVFFGDGPYTLLPNVDASSSLTYTPLIINPVSEHGILGDASPNYFIGVKSIKINDKRVQGYNETFLSIDAEGVGGTSISTLNPYTIMESSIYNAVVAAFVKAMPKSVKKVASVSPFEECFSSKNIGTAPLGPEVPSIDLVLDSNKVWRIDGANSMVQVNKNVLCLGFLSAPSYMRPTTSVVIGGHQIEDNLLQFDLVNSRLGFSSSLLERSTSCASFNFTSTT